MPPPTMRPKYPEMPADFERIRATGACSYHTARCDLETLHYSLTREEPAFVPDSIQMLCEALVAFTMLCGYFLTDVMSPLKPMLEKELLWDSLDYGFFTSAYGWFNVFLRYFV